MSRSSQDFQRPLLPAAAPPEPETHPAASRHLLPRHPRIGVSVACENCRKRKVRCNGSRPRCAACVRTGHECVYIPTSKDRELKRKYEDLETEKTTYQKVIDLLRSRKHGEANLILDLLRQNTSVHDVLRQVEHGDMLCELSLVPETRYRYVFPYCHTLPAFLKSRDNPYLRSPIYEWAMDQENHDPSSGTEGPAQPAALFVNPYHAAEVIIPWLDSVEPSRWTSVCSNNVLMRKILRAYFLHDYEWFTFLHKDYFFQDMAAARQRFCSPLLYCYRQLPHRLEFWNPHTLGYKFLAEARRLWEVEEASSSNKLTTLQAGLFINAVYNMMGADRIGWTYTLRAVEIAQTLRLFDSSAKVRSRQSQHNRDFTAWALFAWQSHSSYHFCKHPAISSPPPMPLPDPDEHPKCRFFKAKAEFLVILNEVALQIFDGVEREPEATAQNLSELRSRMHSWYNKLPKCLTPTTIALPAHLKLHMHYYYVLINLHKPVAGMPPPKPPEVSEREVASANPIEDEFVDAYIRLETLLRIYYLRHGFDHLDMFLLAYLVFFAFTNLHHLKKSTDPVQLESLRSTLLLAAKGLREQGSIYFLAMIMFQLIYRDMRPEEVDLFGRFVTMGQKDPQQKIPTDFIHSQWPIKVTGLEGQSENKILDDLVKEHEDLSLGSTEGSTDASTDEEM
ncbi:Nitrogen assimilation transcription factor nirA [Fusarium oxysporum f. sp. rapae]|uniref:Nitrogen assimilation transcription factor nirA n=1 Tax=Fusarium oxysporum f. sp. rapae TaxID=485398 RepID=A0A8J5TMN6_FUSOX|nr:Nitrogen assimilation transcription factor nirA [Fusarium oxysporum f. sp. rapae]